MLLPTQNKQLAKEYFDSLPENDLNRKFYNDGLAYKPSSTFIGKLVDCADIPRKISTLKHFYPYQRVIQATETEYYEDWKQGLTTNVAITAVAWFTIFGFARYGKVAPILREYGAIFKTHRVFRHYLHALVLPLLYTTYSINHKYLTHVDTLWAIHANRLNQKILDDPNNTVYPRELSDRKRMNF